MDIFLEAFPFVFGVLLGVTAHRLGNLRERWQLYAAACAPLGALATFATGEYRASLWYFAFDIGLVAGVAAGCVALLELKGRTFRG